jgi:hypothetical protein
VPKEHKVSKEFKVLKVVKVLRVLKVLKEHKVSKEFRVLLEQQHLGLKRQQHILQLMEIKLLLILLVEHLQLLYLLLL